MALRAIEAFLMQFIIVLGRILSGGIRHSIPTLATIIMVIAITAQIIKTKMPALRKCRFTKEEEMGGHTIAWWSHGRKVQHE